MPTITKIEPQKRLPDRFNIYVDGVYSFAVSLEVLMTFHLKEKMELTLEQIEKLVSEENLTKIYTKALGFISYQIRTKKEIKDKLQKLVSKSIEDATNRADVISKVLQRLEDAQFIDDANYARLYVQNALTLKQVPSKQKVSMFLRKKGIANAIIEDNLLYYSPENELDGAKTIFLKKLKQLGGAAALSDPKIKSKVWRFLAGKGYSSDVVRSLFDTLPEAY